MNVIHSFTDYLWSTFSVGARDTAGKKKKKKKTDKNPCPAGIYILVGKDSAVYGKFESAELHGEI